MSNSRRDFLKGGVVSGAALQLSGLPTAVTPARSEMICRLNILTNQVGYLTQGTKKFVVESNIDPLKTIFRMRDTECLGEGVRVFQGQLEEVNGDFGRYWVGDFSELRTPGKYVIHVYTDTPKGPFSSHVFAIGDDVYQDVLEKGLGCFALQRCGPSTTGYHSPCHLDDGVRADNGQFLDVVGGWHDASDVNKQDYDITGLLGLLEIAENSGKPTMMARIFEEVRWGNLLFLKLQDPQGYVYGGNIGGDAPKDGLYWSDNVRGTADDRKIPAKVGPIWLQHMFITGQAHLASLYREWDSVYAKTCLDAAIRCFDWLKKQPAHEITAAFQYLPGISSGGSYVKYSTGARAGISLYKATGQQEYLDYAIRMADKLIALQQTHGGKDELKGYFYEDETRQYGVQHWSIPAFCMPEFCRFIEEMKKQKQDTSRWEEALALFCDGYLAPVSKLNAFGIVPHQVQVYKTILPGARTFRNTRYRYFMSHLNGDWWGGRNVFLAGTGIALCQAARICGTPQYREIAQRMLDWILGLNPFGVCMVNGVGHNNPPEYVYTGFQPRTPLIPGSVVLGIAGDAEDRPDLQPGTWHTGEICLPHTVSTMWLISELMQSKRRSAG